jgi:hypothetical protein
MYENSVGYRFHWLPANEDTVDAVEDIDQFVKVYYVKDRNDFIQVNRQITTIGRL